MINNYFRVRSVEFFFDDTHEVSTASARRAAREYAKAVNEIEKQTVGLDVEPPDIVVWNHAAPVGCGPRDMTCVGGCELCAQRPLTIVGEDAAA